MDESISSNKKMTAEKHRGTPIQDLFACPSHVFWLKEVPQSDLYIKSNIMTVLAMDGRRRVMDIERFVRPQTMV